MSSVLAPVLMMPPGRPLMKKMTSSRGRLLALRTYPKKPQRKKRNMSHEP
jgi:hypothetical protein